MLVRQSIPLPEEKKTLSHVVARTTPGLAGRGVFASSSRKVRVPELSSNKFGGDGDFFGESLHYQGSGNTLVFVLSISSSF